MPVIGVQLLQLVGESVGVSGGETIGGRSYTTPHLPEVWGSRSSPLRDEAANRVKHVQCPAAFLDADFFQRFDALELRAHFLRRNDDHTLAPRLSGARAGERGFDTRRLTAALSPVGDGGEGDVVTTAMRASAGMRFKSKLQPTQPARRAVDDNGFPSSSRKTGLRRDEPLDDGGGREGEAGDEQEVFHPPRRQIIVQEKEADACHYFSLQIQACLNANSGVSLILLCLNILRSSALPATGSATFP